MQAVHMRLASDFQVGHMRIVRQENYMRQEKYMREERLGGHRTGEVQIHKRVAWHALVWVQGVYN